MIPVYRSYQINNDLSIAADTITQSLFRAQMLAMSSEGDATWGVHPTFGSITVFQGSSYAGRDQNYDEVFSLQNSISFSFNPPSVVDFIFYKSTGLPQETATLTIVATTGETKNITVNSKGLVTY